MREREREREREKHKEVNRFESKDTIEKQKQVTRYF